MQPSEVSRSPLRWAGSKKKLVPTLRRLSPPSFKRYVEPFCGSLCLFVAMKPPSALVGDINAELVNFYRCIRTSARKVADLAHDYKNDEKTYYALRSLPEDSLTKYERAARFLYLNRYCFNGVYRTNRQGQFNVARGQHMGEMPAREELLAFGKLMKAVDVRQCDFSTILSEAGRGDFVYLDPPYAGRDVRDRGEYGLGAFKAQDIDRLSDIVQRASKRGAKILLSYADLPEIRSHFTGWNIVTVSVPRNVSGFSRGRSRVSEIIIRNY